MSVEILNIKEYKIIAKSSKKKAGRALLKCNKIGFKAQSLLKRGHMIMTFIPISQEYVIIINVFSPNMNLKYRSQNLIKLKEELDKYIIIVKIFT